MVDLQQQRLPDAPGPPKLAVVLPEKSRTRFPLQHHQQGPRMNQSRISIVTLAQAECGGSPPQGIAQVRVGPLPEQHLQAAVHGALLVPAHAKTITSSHVICLSREFTESTSPRIKDKAAAPVGCSSPWCPVCAHTRKKMILTTLGMEREHPIK
eukprot:996902-Pelagomonas_calceolata.AAC.6